ncbi:MAG: fused MFS/spermidine synthase [Vulcanimicrobiota bacterium]
MARPSSRLTTLLAWSQLFFFFSGATGLIYQVLWTRRLTLTYGHTVLAVSTVLTAFMAGLALGSMAAGRWSDSRSGQVPASRFLAYYGWLEAFVGGWAFLTLPLLGLVEKGYVALASSGVDGTPLHVACFFGAALVLVPPTTAMGATVPLLTRLLVQQRQDLGRVLSRLYGLNTLGAVLGAGLGGFVLLPVLGLIPSMLLTALVNLLIGYGAVVVSQENTVQGEADDQTATTVGEERFALKGLAVPFTFCLAGIASMSYQVGWNRALALSLGSSIYAFSTILVCFLTGLGLGSLVYASLARRGTPRAYHLGVLYLLIAVGGGLTIPTLGYLPRLFIKALTMLGGESFVGVLTVDVALSFLVLGPPTFLMGLGFPLATAVYAGGLGRLGRSVGDVYSANTLGCIMGAFITGFVIIPQVGAQWSLQIATLIYLGCALLMVLLEPSRVRWPAAVAIPFLALLAWNVPGWSTGVMGAGVAVHPEAFLDPADKRELRFPDPAVFVDGLSATVTLTFSSGFFETLSLRVNGKTDASTGSRDERTQYFLGYLPTLFHPAPKRVGVIGLGAGFTLQAVAACPGVEQIICAELEPAVYQVGEYWKPHNGRVLEDPRVEVHLTDGRTFVLGAEQKFDVLISEPSNPWIAGVGNLFTRDFYFRALDRLNPDGIMCQWFNLYAVNTDDIQMVLHSFYDVFPEGQVWQSDGGDLILLGSRKPFIIDASRIRQYIDADPEHQREFYEMGVFTPDVLWGFYLCSRDQVWPRVKDAPLNTDNRPLLEFSAPLSLYSRDLWTRNYRFIESLAQGSLPPGIEATPERLAKAAMAEAQLFNVPRALATLNELNEDLDDVLVARGLCNEQRTDVPKVEALQMARVCYRDVLKRSPGHPLAAAMWGELEYSQGNFAKAVDLFRVALYRPLPGSEHRLWMRVGECYYRLGQASESVGAFRAAFEADPQDALALAFLGQGHLNLGQHEAGRRVIDKALEINPYQPFAILGDAFAHHQAGDLQAAIRSQQRFLELVPDTPREWLRLAKFQREAGDVSGARASLERLLELEPNNSEARKALDGLS